MNRHVIVIEGPDAEEALVNLISNCEYDKLDVAVWVADVPVVVEKSTLAYASIGDE